MIMLKLLILAISTTFENNVDDIVYEVECKSVTQQMIDDLNATDKIEIRKWVVGDRQQRGRHPFDVRKSLISAELVDGKLIQSSRLMTTALGAVWVLMLVPPYISISPSNGKAGVPISAPSFITPELPPPPTATISN